MATITTSHGQHGQHWMGLKMLLTHDVRAIWLMAAMLAVGAVSAQTPAGQAPAGWTGAARRRRRDEAAAAAARRSSRPRSTPTSR